MIKGWASRLRPEEVLKRPWLACVLITLWIGLESFALGPFSYFQLDEFGDGVFACWRALFSGAYGSGIHYWLPSVACGVDRLANSLMYPQALGILTWLLPGWAAYQVFLFIHYFFASYFTCRLCTDNMKTSTRAGILAGFAFAFVSPFTGAIGSSVFPFVLWAFDRILDSQWKRGLIGSALLGLFFCLFASPVASMPFCFIWGFLWFILVRNKLSLKLLVLGGVFAACSVVPHLQEMWAMLTHAQFSQRATWGAVSVCTAPSLGRALEQGLHWLWRSSGVTATVALAGLIASRLRTRGFGKVMAMLLFTVVASGAGEWFKTCLGLSSGVLSGFRAHRFFLLLPLASGLAGAAGLELLGTRRTWVFPLAMAILFSQTLHTKSITIWKYHFQGGYVANYGSPVLEDLARKRDPLQPFRVATFTHGMLPSYVQSYGLESVDGYIGNYPKAYFRFWGKVIEPVMRREPYLEDYFGHWGSQIYLFLHSVEDWPGGLRFTDHYRLPLLSLANTKYIISRHPLEDPNFKLLTPQKPWYSMSWKERNWLRITENFTGKRYFYIYENTSALPRAFLAYDIKVLSGENVFWDAMAGATIEELKRKVYVEASHWHGGNLLGGSRKGDVKVARYEADRLDLDVRLDGPGILVVSNSFNPFWKCLVDGQESPVFPAYEAFWGVVLKAGDRKVEFRYDPPYRTF